MHRKGPRGLKRPYLLLFSSLCLENLRHFQVAIVLWKPLAFTNEQVDMDLKQRERLRIKTELAFQNIAVHEQREERYVLKCPEIFVYNKQTKGNKSWLRATVYSQKGLVPFPRSSCCFMNSKTLNLCVYLVSPNKFMIFTECNKYTQFSEQ